MRIERDFERAFARLVKECGGVSYHTLSTSTRGFPDRTVLINGRVHLVELKRPKGSLSWHQTRFIAQAEALGIHIPTLYTIEQAKEWLNGL